MRLNTHSSRSWLTEQRRRLAASLGLIVVLNALFALVHTLRATSALAESVWQLGWHGGFMAIAAMLGGAYVFAYHEKQPVMALSMALAALLSQIHLFYAQPALLGWPGLLYYMVDFIAITVVAYDLWMQREKRRESRMAQVVPLTDRRQYDSRHVA